MVDINDQSWEQVDASKGLVFFERIKMKNISVAYRFIA